LAGFLDKIRKNKLLDRLSNIIGYLYVALIIGLIYLKLSEKIDWAWKWVVAPFWIPAAILLVGFVLFYLFIHFNKDRTI